MLRKCILKRKTVFIAGAIVLLILWALTLLFGNGEDKIMVLVLSLALPFAIYGFVRLMFKVVRINAPLKFVKFGIYFFLLMSALYTVVGLVGFVVDFPNGLSPSLTACFGLIMAALDEIKENTATEG